MEFVPILMALKRNKVGAILVLAVLLAAIVWNLGTWWLGIPCSSSHTMIGAMIGGGLGFTMYYAGSVNWSKASEIGLSLVLSPLFGFGAAMLLMYFLRHIIKSPILFHAPTGENDRPPILIRLLLITTCTLVSFFHGSNDGQKGVGLLMLILIAFLPAKFAVDRNTDDAKILVSLNSIQGAIAKVDPSKAGAVTLDQLSAAVDTAKATIAGGMSRDDKHVFAFRKQLQAVVKDVKAVLANKGVDLPADNRATLTSASKGLNDTTEYAPVWAIATISLSLGIGTMIGWKRIVLTIGEKIGKEHLNYAQGMTAEITAAATIGLSSGAGLPVSTTHVLSSGIAGAMVASNGTKNLNSNTLKAIGMAWVLTLPVSIALSFVLFFIFHLFV